MAAKKSAKKKAPKVEPADLQATVASQGLLGNFVNVVGGEHKGLYGVTQPGTEDYEAGTVVLRTRDDETKRETVNFDDLERATAGGR